MNIVLDLYSKRHLHGLGASVKILGECAVDSGGVRAEHDVVLTTVPSKKLQQRMKRLKSSGLLQGQFTMNPDEVAIWQIKP